MAIQKISSVNHQANLLSFQARVPKIKITEQDVATFRKYEDLIDLLAKNKCISNAAMMKQRVLSKEPFYKAFDVVKKGLKELFSHSSVDLEKRLLIKEEQVGYFPGHQSMDYSDEYYTYKVSSPVIDALKKIKSIGTKEDAIELKKLLEAQKEPIAYKFEIGNIKTDSSVCLEYDDGFKKILDDKTDLRQYIEDTIKHIENK